MTADEIKHRMNWLRQEAFALRSVIYPDTAAEVDEIERLALKALSSVQTEELSSKTAIERAVMERLQRDVFHHETPENRHARSCIQDVLNNYPGGPCHAASVQSPRGTNT